MTFRAGGWLLTVAFAALAIIKTLWLAKPELPLTIPLLGLTVATVLGLVVFALGSTAWARRLFAVAAVAQASLVFAQLELHALGIVTLVAPAAFAGGAMVRGAGKRLAWSVIPMAMFFAVGFVIYQPVPWIGPLALDLMCTFLALDLLGAFPAHAHVPHAAIPNLAIGRLVTVVGFALIAAGGWLLWVTVDQIARRSVSLQTPLLYAAVVVMAGVLGLWRRRRNVSLPIVIAIVVCIGGTLEGIEELVKTPFDRAVLVTRELPMARIALPSGDDTTRAFRDAGNIEIAADHVELDHVGVGWGYRNPPTLDDPDAATIEVGDVTVTIYDDASPHRTAFLIWTCGGTQLRASFGAEGTYMQVHNLASRIAHSIECTPLSPTVPPLELPVSLPPTYRELAIDDLGFRTFRGPDTIHFSLAWTKDTNWAVELDRDALGMFEWFVDEKTLAEVREPVRKVTTIVDGEYRWYAEVTIRDRRRLVAVYYCEALGAYASVGFDGPASVPLADVLALVNAARCP